MIKLKASLSSIINIEVFCLVMAGGALISWMEPTLAVSEFEKRELTPLPVFSLVSLFDGHYTDSLDLYYADHFAQRENLVEFTSSLKGYFGFRQNDLMVYTRANPGMVGLDSIPVDSITTKTDPKTKHVIKKDPTGQPPETKNSIVIYNGMAFQLFGRNRSAEDNYAASVNAYSQRLGDTVRFFLCLVPSALDFNLPDEYKSKSNHESPSIDYIYSQLNSKVLAVDAYSNLEATTNDFNFLKTDHHWSARGAYQAYLAFCERAKLQSVSLSAYHRMVRRSFLGSLYYATLDARLKQSGDSLEYFIPPLKMQAWRYPTRDLQKSIPTEVVSQRLGKAGTYLTFIGGDYPLTQIITENKNGKKLLMVKDSYGNALVPFLTPHYQEVLVIDYRSFDSNIISLIKQHNISDLLFLHNISIANTKYAATRESYLMRIKDLKPVLKQDTVMVF